MSWFGNFLWMWLLWYFSLGCAAHLDRPHFHYTLRIQGLQGVLFGHKYFESQGNIILYHIPLQYFFLHQWCERFSAVVLGKVDDLTVVMLGSVKDMTIVLLGLCRVLLHWCWLELLIPCVKKLFKAESASTKKKIILINTHPSQG